MDKLQWGNRKRLRCVKVKDSPSTGKSDGGGRGRGSHENGFLLKKKITTRVFDTQTPHPFHSPPHLHRDLGMSRFSSNGNMRISTFSSLDKDDHCYTTRGSGGLDENSTKMFTPCKEGTDKKAVWPKLYIALSSKEKEEDFMAMKGCKLPQRPKKRAKLIQRSLHLVSPGAWLSDLCQERYEVREKKTSKKRPRGLKAMGGMESDSE